MAGSPGLDYVVETAKRVWQSSPHRNVRIPVADKDRAFQAAIQEALEEIGVPNQRKHPQNVISSRREIAGHAIRVVIAYLAARILEDKAHIPLKLLLNEKSTATKIFFTKSDNWFFLWNYINHHSYNSDGGSTFSPTFA